MPVDQTFYVALYEDENCTKLASEIKALTFKNSTSETVTFEGVEPNKTYYVGECTKDGVRYLSGVVAGTKYVCTVYRWKQCYSRNSKTEVKQFTLITAL